MKRQYWLLATLAMTTQASFAGVDKIYGPNVDAREFELEMRGISSADSGSVFDGAMKSKIGLGYGISSRIFVEGYLQFEEPVNGDYRLEAYEIEAKFQLTEKGKYFADVGLLTELEKSRDNDEWEPKIGPLIQKPFGNWIGTVNLFGETKFGADTIERGKWELIGRAQLKYRLSETFEPGLEFYGDDGTRALGPVMYGHFRLDSAKIGWQLGWLVGLDSVTADNTIRWQFELEF